MNQEKTKVTSEDEIKAMLYLVSAQAILICNDPRIDSEELVLKEMNREMEFIIKDWKNGSFE